MKKSALILSMLVVASSVAPVVAMENGQQAQPSRSIQLAAHLYNLVRYGQAALTNVGVLCANLNDFRNEVDGVVGDQKDQTENARTESGVSGFFNDTARVVRNNLRSANIPGMESVVNDNNMSFIKLGLLGLAGYMLLRIMVNTFPSQTTQSQTTS